MHIDIIYKKNLKYLWPDSLSLGRPQEPQVLIFFYSFLDSLVLLHLLAEASSISGSGRRGRELCSVGWPNARSCIEVIVWPEAAHLPIADCMDASTSTINWVEI